jgi:hypothetical protein
MTTRTINGLLLCLFANYALVGQEKAPPSPTKVQIDIRQFRKPQASPNGTNVTNTNSLSVFDAFSNIVVQPGQTLPLVSAVDWTGADHVSIAIECPTSTSLQNVGIAVLWSMPVASNYTATDLISGKNFLVPNMGGAVVPAYGNQLGLGIINSGTTIIACDQVTVYGVVH